MAVDQYTMRITDFRLPTEINASNVAHTEAKKGGIQEGRTRGKKVLYSNSRSGKVTKTTTAAVQTYGQRAKR